MLCLAVDGSAFGEAQQDERLSEFLEWCKYFYLNLRYYFSEIA